MDLTPEQKAALEQLEAAVKVATKAELFDVMAAFVHPDRINNFCDDLEKFGYAVNGQTA